MKSTELSRPELIYSCYASSVHLLGYRLLKAGRWAYWRSQGITACSPAGQRRITIHSIPLGDLQQDDASDWRLWYRVETGYHCLFPHQHSCNTSKKQNRLTWELVRQRLFLQQCCFSTLYWQSLILCKGPNSTIAGQVMKGRCGAESQWMNHWNITEQSKEDPD